MVIRTSPFGFCLLTYLDHAFISTTEGKGCQQKQLRPPSPPVIYQPVTSSSLRIQASFTFNDQERVSEGEGEGESEGERRRDEEKVRKRERVSEGEKKMEGGR